MTATRLDDSSDSIQARELSSIDEADWQTAEERLATIRPLLGDVRRTRESVAIQAQAAKVHAATVYRCVLPHLEMLPKKNAPHHSQSILSHM